MGMVSMQAVCCAWWALLRAIVEGSRTGVLGEGGEEADMGLSFF